MTPRKQKEQTSKPPKNRQQKKKWALRKLYEVQERAFTKLFGGRAAEHRSIQVSREIVKLLSPVEDIRADDARVLLAAKALGLMQSLYSEERNEFLKDATGRVAQLVVKHKMGEIFAEDWENADDVVNAVTAIQGFNYIAGDWFDSYHSLALLDSIGGKKDGDYRELYANPIISGALPRAVIIARLVDLATEPQKKVDYLRLGETEQQEKELDELYRIMNAVYYPIADMMGFGNTLAVQIRRNATDLLEKLLSRKDGDHEDVVLYRECKQAHYDLEPKAEMLAEELVKKGKLARILEDISRRFGIRVWMASHTCNADELYRVKGPGGVYWKIKRKREEGEKLEREGKEDKEDKKNFTISRIDDWLGMTVVVDGSVEDARKVAQWILVGLLQMQIKKMDIKDKERESGYWVPHVVFKAKIDGVEVPAEIQVRPADIHEESKTGKYSHGKKVNPTFVDEELVEALGAEFIKNQAVFDTQRDMRREDLELGEVEELESYYVRIAMEVDKAPQLVSVRARKDEIVAGVLALVSEKKGKECCMVGEKIRIMDGFMKDKLGIKVKCPREIFVFVGEGKKISPETWKKSASDVLTPEAQKFLTEIETRNGRKR